MLNALETGTLFANRSIMASGSSKAPGKPHTKLVQDNTPRVVIIRSAEAQQTFVAQSLEALELLGQHPDRLSDVMDAGFRIEVEAIEHGFRAIAAAARSLSTQAAELYLREQSATNARALKATVDLLSVLLLRVYITGNDVDSAAQHAAPQTLGPRTNAHLRCVH